MKNAIFLVGLIGLLSVPAGGRAESTKIPFDSELQDIVGVRISDEGLQFLARLLGEGLLQPTLKSDIIGALEDEAFQVLIPLDVAGFPIGGGFAQFVVDFGESSTAPELDGFRFDDLTVDLSTVPASTNLVPEAGVLYPRINLNGWSGSEFVDQLPELWIRVNYPPFGITDVPGVARAKLSTSGSLRPEIGPGTIGFLVEDFDSQISEFKVDIFGGLTTQQQEGLGQAIQDGFSKELEDALADVLQQGINDILFDRNLDGQADTLLNIEDVFSGLNDALDTDFGFTMEPHFQTNATFPTTVLLRVDGSMFLNTPGDCVGADIDDGFEFTTLEQDQVAGHDPPQIVETAAGATEPAQFVVTVSDDFLNQLLFNGYRSGLACLFLNPLAPSTPTDIAELLITDSLAIFVGNWITDLFPAAPIGFRMRMLRAPSVKLPKSGDDQIKLGLPSVQVDLMVYDHDRWLRLMGASASIELAIAINDLSLGGDEFIDAGFSFDISNVINFAEYAPDRKTELQDLLPTGISLAEGALSEILSGSAGDFTECVDGLDISFFQLDTIGADPLADFAHYLGLWLSFDGEVDLGLLFECLLGEALIAEEATSATTGVTTATLAPLPPARDIQLQVVSGGVPLLAEDLADGHVARWRFVPGFWHRPDDAVPAMPLGVRLWEWEDVNGNRHQIRLKGEQIKTERKSGCGVGSQATQGLALMIVVFWMFYFRRKTSV